MRLKRQNFQKTAKTEAESKAQIVFMNSKNNLDLCVCLTCVVVRTPHQSPLQALKITQYEVVHRYILPAREPGFTVRAWKTSVDLHDQPRFGTGSLQIKVHRRTGSSEPILKRGSLVQ